MNIAIESKSSNSKSLIQTAATRASCEQAVRFIFENRGTNGALNPEAQGLLFASSAQPFVDYQKRKDDGQENEKVDEDQDRQFNTNHSGVPPQRIVTTPQSRRGPGLKRSFRMKDSAVSSIELLPLDVRRKRKSTSPSGLTPMKKELGSARVKTTGKGGKETNGRC